MNRLSVYLAGSIGRRQEIRELANELRGRGFDVTSRWLVEVGPNLTYSEYPIDTLAKHATRDTHDILRARAFVRVANPEGYPSKGGGRHWETGFAYAHEKPIVVFGRRETVFDALPGVRFAAEHEELIEKLEEIEQEIRSEATEWSEENVENVYAHA